MPNRDVMIITKFNYIIVTVSVLSSSVLFSCHINMLCLLFLSSSIRVIIFVYNKKEEELNN